MRKEDLILCFHHIYVLRMLHFSSPELSRPHLLPAFSGEPLSHTGPGNGSHIPTQPSQHYGIKESSSTPPRFHQNLLRNHLNSPPAGAHLHTDEHFPLQAILNCRSTKIYCLNETPAFRINGNLMSCTRQENP